jgi:hypothetical protein
MARVAGQIAARGASTWLVRVYLGRDPQTGARKYHNQTISRSVSRSATAFSISGISNGITAACLARLSRVRTIARPVAFNCSQGSSQGENVPGLPNETTERYLETEQDFVSAVNDNLGLER